MQNVLLIPSWYPNLENPLNGSFFQEQAQFLNGKSGIEIQVLYGEKKSRSLFIWIGIFLQSWFKSSWKIFKDKLVQNPVAYGFSIPANRRVPDFLQITLELMLFEKAYRSFYKKGWQPNLIHAQSGMDAGIYAHHLSRRSGIPFVIIEHQVFVFHYYSRLRSTLIMDAFKAAKRTAAVSYDECRQVMMNQPECNPQVIWNLVDEERYSIDHDRRNQEFTVITILNSLPIKGAVEFLEAMVLVIQSKPSIRFIMIGKGGDEKSFEPSENLFIQESKELKIYENGEFLPFVHREKISEVLNRAHVFVSPSIQEPHGIAVREAMMCGLPIVSTANGGVEDSILPETGIIVPIRNSEEMAKAILKVKENYSKYDPKAIRSLAVSQSGREAFLRSMLSFYKM